MHKSNTMSPIQRATLPILLLAALAHVAFASPEIPGAKQAAPIALVGGTIHPVSSPPIEQGTLVFDQGRITAIGRRVKIPAGAERIDVSASHVYPGLINAYSSLGLVEIGAVRATLEIIEPATLQRRGRCIWLDEDGRCGHYEHRPEICRRFQRGGGQCLNVLTVGSFQGQR